MVVGCADHLGQQPRRIRQSRQQQHSQPQRSQWLKKARTLDGSNRWEAPNARINSKMLTSIEDKDKGTLSPQPTHFDHSAASMTYAGNAFECQQEMNDAYKQGDQMPFYKMRRTFPEIVQDEAFMLFILPDDTTLLSLISQLGVTLDSNYDALMVRNTLASTLESVAIAHFCTYRETRYLELWTDWFGQPPAVMGCNSSPGTEGKWSTVSSM